MYVRRRNGWGRAYLPGGENSNRPALRDVVPLTTRTALRWGVDKNSDLVLRVCEPDERHFTEVVGVGLDLGLYSLKL